MDRNGEINSRPPISRRHYENSPKTAFVGFQLLLNMIHFSLIFVCQFVLGQFAIEKFDFCMVKLEKTLEFCVPIGLNDAESFNRKNLERPLSWGLFIPLLVGLRFLRFCLSICTITMGQGVVSAKHMHLTMVEIRRYYRSIQHYAVRRYTSDEQSLREKRIMRSRFWRLVYRISESIIVRKSRFEELLHDEKIDDAQQNGSHLKIEKSNLNSSSPSVENEDTPSSEIVETFLQWNRSASKKTLKSKIPSKAIQQSSQCKQSESQPEIDASQKEIEAEKALQSETKDRFDIDEQKLTELENQLLHHFKTSFNYPPSSSVKDVKEDIFYSPIGSPPENNGSS